MTSGKAILTVVAAAVLAAGAFALRERAREAETGPLSAPRRGVYAFDLYEEERRLHMLLVEYAPGSETPSLLYTRSDDGGEAWSDPVRVDEGALPAFVPYRGVDPQLAARGNAVVAVWTAAGDDIYGYGTGPLATAVSSDGGNTWRAGPNPADDGLTTAHEFLDVMADARDGFTRSGSTTGMTTRESGAGCATPIPRTAARAGAPTRRSTSTSAAAAGPTCGRIPPEDSTRSTAKSIRIRAI